MITKKQVEAFGSIETPFYFYDMDLLRKTLDIYKALIDKYGYNAHYAMKANANDRILETIKGYGLGADCVSGNEVKLAVKSGFDPQKIVYAGVGKSDKEIKAALKAGIFSFNCESVPEIRIISQLAAAMGRKARISIRVNPDIDAHTHKYISTGLKENKFGISPWAFQDVVDTLAQCPNLELLGLHFHVGSQITELPVFCFAGASKNCSSGSSSTGSPSPTSTSAADSASITRIPTATRSPISKRISRPSTRTWWSARASGSISSPAARSWPSAVT